MQGVRLAEYIRKIVMLGNPGVGKTSLVRKFVHDMFDDKYLSTLGAKPTKKLIKVGDDNLTMMIWDLAGQNFNLHPAYYGGAKGALLVCDLTRKDTAEALVNWYSALIERAGDIPIVVLANKSDLDGELDIERLEEMGFNSMKTSAKTGENVELAFQELAEMMLNG